MPDKLRKANEHPALRDVPLDLGVPRWVSPAELPITSTPVCPVEVAVMTQIVTEESGDEPAVPSRCG